jgi:VWFA-related protein
MNVATFSRRLAKALSITIIALLLAVSAAAQRQAGEIAAAGKEVTVLVTTVPNNERSREIAAKLQPSDFIVLEEKQRQQILSVKRASEAPMSVAVLMQDDLASHVNNEIQCIKDFIRQLPEGSQVMVAYITTGALRVTQDFTTDRARAADSMRVIVGSRSASTYSPYIEVTEAIRRFDKQPMGRRIILLVADGLDLSSGYRGASPLFSPYLEQAISEAQRRSVAIFPFFAPTSGLLRWDRIAVNYGQGSLNRLADETGGEGFFTGTDLVSFDPYFKELNELFDRQWLITYRSSNTGKGFRKIEVTTDFDLHLHHPAGYRARGEEQSKK